MLAELAALDGAALELGAGGRGEQGGDGQGHRCLLETTAGQPHHPPAAIQPRVSVCTADPSRSASLSPGEGGGAGTRLHPDGRFGRRQEVDEERRDRRRRTGRWRTRRPSARGRRRAAARTASVADRRHRRVGDELAGHGPGLDDDDRHAERSGDRREALEEPLDGELGGAVGLVERLADDAADAADREHPAARGAQVRHGRLDHAHDAEEVDLHGVAERVQAERLDRADPPGAGVVHDGVERAVVGDDLVDHRADVATTVTSSARMSIGRSPARSRRAPAFDRSRIVATMVQPAAAAASAVSRPMPVDVPVIRQGAHGAPSCAQASCDEPDHVAVGVGDRRDRPAGADLGRVLQHACRRPRRASRAWPPGRRPVQ